MGMASMFFPTINSGLWETLLTFVAFFSPQTQVRDKMLTLESSSRTGLVVESAQQFLFSDSKAGPLRTGQQLTLEYENPAKI